MSVETPSSCACIPADRPAAAASHQALARCREAFEQTIATPLRGNREFATMLLARKAYKSALPPLVGAENIRDFIAGVAQGMLLGAIEDDQATRLLYAARAAQSALRNPPLEKQLLPSARVAAN